MGVERFEKPDNVGVLGRDNVGVVERDNEGVVSITSLEINFLSMDA